jgi:hypothetical protein
MALPAIVLSQTIGAEHDRHERVLPWIFLSSYIRFTFLLSVFFGGHEPDWGIFALESLILYFQFLERWVSAASIQVLVERSSFFFQLISP